MYYDYIIRVNSLGISVQTYKVLFVCMGNICRSPTAHGVFRHLVKQANLEHAIEVDSAGTHNYHPNEAPDHRSQSHALARGIDISDLRARQITNQDFERFDLILVMDWENLALTEHKAPSHHRQKIKRLTEFCKNESSPVVPDPYYGGPDGFNHVLTLVEDACQGLLEYITTKLSQSPKSIH